VVLSTSGKCGARTVQSYKPFSVACLLNEIDIGLLDENFCSVITVVGCRNVRNAEVYSVFLTLIGSRYFYNRFSAPGGGKNLPQAYLDFYAAQEQNSNGYTHVVGIRLSKGVVGDIARSRARPEIDMVAAQTGSNTISAQRTARNKVPTAIPTFSRSILCKTTCRKHHSCPAY